MLSQLTRRESRPRVWSQLARVRSCRDDHPGAAACLYVRARLVCPSSRERAFTAPSSGRRYPGIASLSGLCQPPTTTLKLRGPQRCRAEQSRAAPSRGLRDRPVARTDPTLSIYYRPNRAGAKHRAVPLLLRRKGQMYSYPNGRSRRVRQADTVALGSSELALIGLFSDSVRR